MFGKKEKGTEVATKRLPVLTVHTLPQPYEVIGELRAKGSSTTDEPYKDAIERLRNQAVELGADAVIGLIFHSQSTSTFSVYGFGTAVRYLNDGENE